MNEASTAEVVQIDRPKLTQEIAAGIKREAQESGRTIKAVAEERGYKAYSVSNMLTQVYKQQNLPTKTTGKREISVTPKIPIEPTITIKKHQEEINRLVRCIKKSIETLAENVTGKEAFALGRLSEIVDENAGEFR